MANKEPLFEGSINELLSEWFATDVDKHWMDKGTRKIIIYPQPKAWEVLNQTNGDKTSSRS